MHYAYPNCERTDENFSFNVNPISKGDIKLRTRHVADSSKNADKWIFGAQLESASPEDGFLRAKLKNYWINVM